jgi:hypothetical protein
MNTKKNYSLFIGILISCFLMAQSPEIPNEVILGLKEGKAETISKFFKNTVELIIDNKENIYSKTQAQIILKDFFKKNTAESFSILHQGGKGESKYAIGSLKTTQGKYRITLLLKLSNNATYIHQLRIEKDEV